MGRFRGLPQTKKMRHDEHFVDRLAGPPSEALGRQIPIDRIQPSPHQPRRRFEGIDELVASVKEKGVLEPILVRAIDDGLYEIIAGERRYRAALEAGLSRMPCIELDVDDRGCLEISLVENIQRRNLSPFEEADAIVQLRDKFGFTHEDIARKLGRSRTSITETIALAGIPESVRDECIDAGISARSVLLQLARMTDEDEMQRLLAAIRSEHLSRDDVRRMVRGEEGSPEGDGRRQSPGDGGGRAGTAGFTFRVRTPDRPYSLTLRFPEREDVPRAELIKALEEILVELRRGDGSA